VYKKTMRRRRAVLVALVALSLILLTAYFREAPGGSLHAVQHGFLTVVSPIEDGANQVFRPVRNAFSSVGNAFSANTQADKLRRQLARTRAEVISYQEQLRSDRGAAALGNLDNKLGVASYRPVNATVVLQSPSLWDATVIIDQGTPSGVQANDPVIDGEGLVGKVAQAWTDGAEVMLIDDHEFGATARLAASGAFGTVQPKVGDPNDLVLQYLPQSTAVNPGEYVVTSGTVSSQGESLYPSGIPIGRVTSGSGSSQYESVNVEPFVNLHNLSTVQVLTTVNGSPPARITHLLSSLPPGQGTPSSSGAGSGGSLASAGGEG
jgi:rod shape-determining protein MreC